MTSAVNSFLVYDFRLYSCENISFPVTCTSHFIFFIIFGNLFDCRTVLRCSAHFRVAFRGDTVKDDSGSYAVCTEQDSS